MPMLGIRRLLIVHALALGFFFLFLRWAVPEIVRHLVLGFGLTYIPHGMWWIIDLSFGARRNFLAVLLLTIALVLDAAVHKRLQRFSVNAICCYLWFWSIPLFLGSVLVAITVNLLLSAMYAPHY